MTDMLHWIRIEAPPERVYEALTTRAGLSAWWTDDVVAEPRVGSIAEFGFDNRAVLFRMRIDELQPAARVVWSCVGDFEEWTGTRLTWELVRDGKTTDLHFRHAGWRATDGWFALCNTTWGALMYRLRDHAEGKPLGPHFRN